MKTPVSEFAKELGLAQNVIVALPESVFGNAQMSKNADGSTTVSITVDEATFETLYRGAVVNVVYDVVGDMPDQATTKDAVITVTVANDYVKSYGITFVNEIVAGKDSISYTSAQTIEFVSCGEDMTVTAPAGFDAFYEVNWG